MSDDPELWRDRSKCRTVGPDYFYPTVVPSKAKDKTKSSIEGAQSVVAQFCSDCDVKGQCLEYALTNRIDDGVWGGETERGRMRIIRRRKRVANNPLAAELMVG